MFDVAVFDGEVLDGAVCEGFVFDGSVFDGAVFDGAVFDGAVFDDGMFDGAVFDGGMFDGGSPGAGLPLKRGTCTCGRTATVVRRDGPSVGIPKSSPRAARDRGQRAAFVIVAVLPVPMPLNRLRQPTDAPTSRGIFSARGAARVISHEGALSKGSPPAEAAWVFEPGAGIRHEAKDRRSGVAIATSRGRGIAAKTKPGAALQVASPVPLSAVPQSIRIDFLCAPGICTVLPVEAYSG